MNSLYESRKDFAHPSSSKCTTRTATWKVPHRQLPSYPAGYAVKMISGLSKFKEVRMYPSTSIRYTPVFNMLAFHFVLSESEHDG